MERSDSNHQKKQKLKSHYQRLLAISILGLVTILLRLVLKLIASVFKNGVVGRTMESILSDTPCIITALKAPVSFQSK